MINQDAARRMVHRIKAALARRDEAEAMELIDSPGFLLLCLELDVSVDEAVRRLRRQSQRNRCFGRTGARHGAARVRAPEPIA